MSRRELQFQTPNPLDLMFFAFDRAAWRLGALGDVRASSALARLLHHSDSIVAATVERALWRIWFVAGSASARHRLRTAVALMQENRVLDALATLDAIIADE